MSLALCWASLEFGYRFVDDFETAYFLLKINVVWYFVISFLLHFSLLFTENTKLLQHKITYVLIYGPALFFFLVDIFTDLLFTMPIKEQWGWMYGIPEHPLVHTISITWAAFTGFFCLYILLEYLQHTHNVIRRTQTTHIIVGLLIPVATGFNTEYFLPLVGIRVPELFVPTFAIGLIVIWHSIWAYAPAKNRKRYETVINEIDNLATGTIPKNQKAQRENVVVLEV